MGATSKTRDAYGFVELKLDRALDAARFLTARTYLNTFRYGGDYLTEGFNYPDGARNDVIGTEAALHWDIASSNRLTFGGEARHDLVARYFAAGTPGVDQNLPNTVLSAYVQDEHQLTRSISLLAGLRHDAYHTSRDATSPRLAAILRPDLRLDLQAALRKRLPGAEHVRGHGRWPAVQGESRVAARAGHDHGGGMAAAPGARTARHRVAVPLRHEGTHRPDRRPGGFALSVSQRGRRAGRRLRAGDAGPDGRHRSPAT